MEIISKAFLEDKAKAINHLKNQIAENVIEIGRHLSEAKEMCAHGEWEKWVGNNCEFTPQQASTYMRVYQKLGSVQIETRVSISKLKLLASLPEEKTEELIEQHDIENTTVKELKELIKARTVTEAEKQQIKMMADQEAEAKYADRMEALQKRIDEARRSKKRAEEQISEKDKELERAKRELRGKENLEKIKKDIENLKQLRSNFEAELERAGMLGELKAEIDEILRRLAPAKYHKLANPNSEVMKNALKSIIGPVKKLILELETLLGV